MVRIEAVDDELYQCLVSTATDSAASCVLNKEHDPGQCEVSEVFAVPSANLAIRAIL